MTLRNLRLAPLGLCVGFASVIAAKAFVPLPGATAPERMAEQKEVTQIELRVWSDLAPMVAEILARPLFNPSRQRPETVFLEEKIVDAKQPPQLQARLVGVTLGPDTREALFQRAGEGTIAVRVGGEIDGWRILFIQLDGVVLTSEFGDQVVKPTDAPARPAVTQANAPDELNTSAQPGIAVRNFSTPSAIVSPVPVPGGK